MMADIFISRSWRTYTSRPFLPRVHPTEADRDQCLDAARVGPAQQFDRVASTLLRLPAGMGGARHGLTKRLACGAAHIGGDVDVFEARRASAALDSFRLGDLHFLFGGSSGGDRSEVSGRRAEAYIGFPQRPQAGAEGP
jgi:hypothetical protein